MEKNGALDLFERAGWKEYFKSSRSVLLVIDPQNDVLDEKGFLNFWQVWKHARENGSIENIKKIVAACRKSGVPVIWGKQYRLEKGRDLFPGTWDGDSLTLIRTLIPNGFLQNTWETDIYEGLADCVDEKDILIGKHGSSMFEGTALEKHRSADDSNNRIPYRFLHRSDGTFGLRQGLSGRHGVRRLRHSERGAPPGLAAKNATDDRAGH